MILIYLQLTVFHPQIIHGLNRIYALAGDTLNDTNREHNQFLRLYVVYSKSRSSKFIMWFSGPKNNTSYMHLVEVSEGIMHVQGNNLYMFWLRRNCRICLVDLG